MDKGSLILSVPILVMSVVCHEVAHGYAAFRLGDTTAYLRGRLSLNPLRHIDPFMTIILPAFLLMTAGVFFGGAKPVPINPLAFRGVSMRKGMMITAAAGPLANLVIALLLCLGTCVVLLAMFVTSGEVELSIGYLLSHSLVYRVLFFSTLMNLFLACFNLIPIPPLDGSRILSYFLPRELSRQMDMLESRFGIMLIFGLFIISGFANLNIIHWVLLPAQYAGVLMQQAAVISAAAVARFLFGVS